MHIQCAIYAALVGVALARPYKPQDHPAIPKIKFDTPSKDIDADVRDMLKKLTLREKIGQMSELGGFMADQMNGNINEGIGYNATLQWTYPYPVGSFFDALGNQSDANPPPLESRDAVQVAFNAYKNSNMTVKIPPIWANDHVHGANYMHNATIFPHAVGMAATFNPALAYQAYEINAKDTRLGGVTWTFAPILDLGANKGWSRLYEDFGEDPYLSSVMAAAAVKGLQGNYKTNRTKIAACMKHFIGYGASRSGENGDEAYIPDGYLIDYYVPPFQSAVDSGVATTMNAYIHVNGQAVASSKKYLVDLLRTKMGFNGVLVTDYQEIESDATDMNAANTNHKVVQTNKEAVWEAMQETSIDMSMIPSDLSFAQYLEELVNEGLVPESRVDESAGRIIQLKKDLGMFEDNFGLPPRDDPLYKTVGSKEDTAVAENAIRESITLLQNNNTVLPLGKHVKKILLAGPHGDSLHLLAGGWTYSWQGDTSDFEFYAGNTLLDGLKKVNPDADITFIEGVAWNGTETDGIDKVVEAAKSADVAILALGEPGYAETPGNINDLTLYQGQLDLAKAVADTGVKTVVALVEGRPRTLGDLPAQVDAILQLYLPGPWAGIPFAEVIFGKASPSGKLSYSYPAGSFNHWLNHWRADTISYNAAWPFGWGMSYGQINYTDISLSSPTLSKGQSIKATVRVTNHGGMATKETVLMMISKYWRSIAPPIQELNGFTKIELEVGKHQDVSFEIFPEMLTFVGRDGKDRIENGVYQVMLGDQSANFTVTGYKDWYKLPAKDMA